MAWREMVVGKLPLALTFRAVPIRAVSDALAIDTKPNHTIPYHTKRCHRLAAARLDCLSPFAPGIHLIRLLPVHVGTLPPARPPSPCPPLLATRRRVSRTTPTLTAHTLGRPPRCTQALPLTVSA
ncbi:uncharacterized protein IWZ02DRAFT_101553 [Phyllosticta citriasiana]|uniref:uncharacterized protein n=1 Tax=Phyllosticta citriasiana TaxID=595635 RepID=UPI0030FD2977